jgi:plastocyanin
MTKYKVHALGLVFVVGLAVLTFAFASQTAQAAATWNLGIGGENPDHAHQYQGFAPSKVTINEGDTIKWTMNPDFVHTVSFLSGGERPADVVPAGEDDLVMQNPQGAFPSGGPTYDGTGFVNSGVLQGKGQSFSLTFTKAGTFKYVCLLHPGMEGEVTVQAAGSATPKTQEQIDAEGKAEIEAALAEAEKLQNSVQVTSKPGTNGATDWTVVNGIGANAATVLRFLPGQVTVKAGDSISFPNMDPHEIHTVTFYGNFADVPPFITPKDQPGGPPKLIIPLAAPSGGTEVADKQIHNSGVVPPDASATFTFPKPGVYQYVCVVHAPQGMAGTVTVTESGATQLPATGADFQLPLFSLLAGAITLIGMGLYLVRRSALMHKPNQQ